MEIQFLITAHLSERVKASESMAKATDQAVKRFVLGDWGEVPPEDKEANNKDLKDRDGRVLARYKTPEGDIYINMEFYPTGENYACVMFCNEY